MRRRFSQKEYMYEKFTYEELVKQLSPAMKAKMKVFVTPI
jgi:hypothetical protein